MGSISNTDIRKVSDRFCPELTAKEFHAATAVMLVQAFDTPAARRGDFEAFRTAMGAREVAPLIYKVDSFNSPSLFLAWCDGDSRFRDVALPSAPQFMNVASSTLV